MHFLVEREFRRFLVERLAASGFTPWVLALVIALHPGPAYPRGPDLRFERISIDQGLSQSSITALLQDRTGFLWIGTTDGLNRYDGYRFKVLRSDPADSGSLASNRIQALLEDRDGMLWIGTRNGGLGRYDPKTEKLTRFEHDPDAPDSLAHEFVWTLHEDRQGTLRIGTGGGGLDRFDPATGTFRHSRHDPADATSITDDFVKAIHEDRAGRFWIGTAAGFNRYDPAAETYQRWTLAPRERDARDYDVVSAIHEGQSGDLWLGTQGGLVRFDPDSSSFTYYRHDPERPNTPHLDGIWDIHEDRTGAFWLSTFGGGLLLFDPASGTFSRSRHDLEDPSSLAGDRLTALFEDRSGAFWIGTVGAGLSKLSRMSGFFAHHGRAQGLSDEMIMAVHEDRGGILWIGTWNGGLNRLDRATGEITHYRADRDDPTRLARDDVRAVLEDSHGNLWVGTEGGGLHRLDRSTGRFTRHQHDPGDPDTLRDADAWVLLEDRGGTLWVGTYGGGLSRYDHATDSFRHYRNDREDPHSLSHDVVRALYEDSAGKLWVGTGGGGLNVFDPPSDAPGSARFTRFRHAFDDPASLSSDEVLSILEDRAGNLWLGTHGGGFNRLVRSASAAPSFRYFTTADGLASNVVYGILEDDKGFLWMSTNRGLSRFDPVAESFRNYDTTDGLESNEFNSGAYFKNRHGELFFGGLGGINSVFPDRVTGNAHIPPVVLTSFKKFNEEVDIEGDPAFLTTVTLGPEENVFSFEAAALSYAAPRKNKYAYRLVGFRDRWIELGTKRDVTFTNLDPGEYTLNVKASNNDGIWNERGLTLEVIVEPPFWKTTWFMVAGALGVLVLLWAGYEARTRSMRKHNLALQAEIAERRRAEEERQRLMGELEANYKQLEARNTEMERFTYTVSHDLKAPLVTIKGFLGLLSRDVEKGDRESAEADMSRIRNAADRMHRLLNDLLELSRAGRAMSPPEAVDLAEIAQDAVAQLSTQISDRLVEVEIDASMPPVYGDRVRLLEVYENLIGNAVKFMGNQARPRIEVGARPNDQEQVRCWVRDNGIGIDPLYHEKVFGLFERLQTDVDGTGVGLALVQRIVEVHGGASWVESDGPGKGSTVFFTFPAGAPPGPGP